MNLSTHVKLTASSSGLKLNSVCQTMHRPAVRSAQAKLNTNRFVMLCSFLKRRIEIRMRLLPKIAPAAMHISKVPIRFRIVRMDIPPVAATARTVVTFSSSVTSKVAVVLSRSTSIVPKVPFTAPKNSSGVLANPSVAELISSAMFRLLLQVERLPAFLRAYIVGNLVIRQTYGRVLVLNLLFVPL